MLEQPPGWTADKERERIRNLVATYYAARTEVDDESAKAQKIEDEQARVLFWGILAGLAGLLVVHWFLPFVVAAFLVFYWRYAGQEVRSARQSVAQRREHMNRLREEIEQAGVSPHSPWTVEKNGQVLGFVPRYEPKL